MDKSLETLLRFWGVFQFTQVQRLLSPHKQCWTRVSRIFSEFHPCIGWGGGRTAREFRKGCTVLRANREMTEKYEYRSTVPRTFAQDCRLFYLYISCCRAVDRAWYARLPLLPTFFYSETGSATATLKKETL